MFTLQRFGTFDRSSRYSVSGELTCWIDCNLPFYRMVISSCTLCRWQTIADYLLFITTLSLQGSEDSLLASYVPQPDSHSCLPGYRQSSITCIQLQTTNRLKYSPGGGFFAARPSSARKMRRQNVKSNRPLCPLITASLHDSKLLCQRGLIQ